MGVFSFNAIWGYISDGSSPGSVDPATTSSGILGTELTDGETDLEFTPDDTITVNSTIAPYDQDGTYIGTTELAGYPGVTWVGIEFTDGSTAYFATVPTDQTGPDINNAWRAEFGSDADNAATVKPQLENTSSLDVVCFAAGSLIATPAGERKVETFQIGDLVTTADGRTVPVKWIGRQTVHKLFSGERARPVRVSAGALGGGLPHADLVLTAEHALILDGLAINAGALVNGTTITLEPLGDLPDRVTYYHIETEDHDIILAYGAPAETYVDYVQRSAFDNHAEYLALYGEDRTIPEMDQPRVSAARLVPPAIRARVASEVAA